MNARRNVDPEDFLDVFVRYGFRKTSMVDLADSTGLSRQALYKRFQNKDTLFSWMAQALVDRSLNEAKKALEDYQSPFVERLMNAFDHWIGRYLDILGRTSHGREIYDLVISEALKMPRKAPEVTSVIARDFVVEGYCTDLAIAEEYAFVVFTASKGLVATTQSRREYLEGLKRVIRVLLPSETTE